MDSVTPMAEPAPPRAVPPGGLLTASERRRRERLRYYSLIRDIRSEAQNLQESVKVILEKSKEQSPDARTLLVRAALNDLRQVFEDNRAEISHLVREAVVERDRDPETADLYGDAARGIQSLWQRIRGATLPSADDPIDSVVVRAQRLDRYLTEIQWLCGVVTIPSRVNQHLRQLRVGQSLVFKRAVGDELPESEHARMLQYLCDHPQAVEGIVDVAPGLIQRASASTLRRAVSYIGELAVMGLFAIAAYNLKWIAEALGIPGVPTDATPSQLLATYVTILLGGAAHVVVDALKQIREARASDKPRVVAFGNWLVWLHVRELEVIAGAFFSALGFLGLVFADKHQDFFVAFLTGYSIDSVADLLLQRFETFVASQPAPLKA